MDVDIENIRIREKADTWYLTRDVFTAELSLSEKVEHHRLRISAKKKKTYDEYQATNIRRYVKLVSEKGNYSHS
jgi:hypothetical protein